MGLVGGSQYGFARSRFKQGKKCLRVLRKCCELYLKLFLVELSEQDTRTPRQKTEVFVRFSKPPAVVFHSISSGRWLRAPADTVFRKFAQKFSSGNRPVMKTKQNRKKIKVQLNQLTLSRKRCGPPVDFAGRCRPG
jgi:hypothetical protein